MERINLKFIKMKVVSILILTCCLFSSCEDENYESYTNKTTRQFNEMKSPVILISKTSFFGLYGVTLIDGEGKSTSFGDMSSLANGIGENYNIGDTIK